MKTSYAHMCLQTNTVTVVSLSLVAGAPTARAMHVFTEQVVGLRSGVGNGLQRSTGSNFYVRYNLSRCVDSGSHVRLKVIQRMCIIMSLHATNCSTL